MLLHMHVSKQATFPYINCLVIQNSKKTPKLVQKLGPARSFLIWESPSFLMIFFENLKFDLEIYRAKNRGEAGAICFDKNHGYVRREEKRRRRERTEPSPFEVQVSE